MWNKFSWVRESKTPDGREVRPFPYKYKKDEQKQTGKMKRKRLLRLVTLSNKPDERDKSELSLRIKKHEKRR